MNQKFKILLVYPNIPGMLVISVAIGIFTAILKKHGFEVDLFDATLYSDEKSISPLKRVEYSQARKFSYKDDLGIDLQPILIDKFKEKIESFKPDLLAVTLVEDAYNQYLEMLKEIKDRKIPQIVGGIFPTSTPETIIANPNINMICLGEGEHAILELAKRLRDGGDISNISNIWYKDESGTIIRNDIEPPIDINGIIPDYDLFDKSRLYRPMGGKVLKTIPLELYRGCPYECSFCCSPMWNIFYKKYTNCIFTRKKSIEAIEKEIQHYIEKYKPELFYIIDDTFLARSLKEMKLFADMYKKYRIPFWMNTRPETLTKEKLQLLKEMNCFRISIGLECGNEEFRKEKLHRSISNEEFIKRMKLLEKSKVPFSVNSIIGFPSETREMIFETIELNRQISGYDALTVSMFTPYHGCELRKRAIEKGYLDNISFTGHTTETSMLNMPHLSKEAIDGLMRTFTMYVTFPKDWWNIIEKAEIDDSIFTKLNKIYLNYVFSKTQDEKRGKINWEELKRLV